MAKKGQNQVSDKNKAQKRAQQASDKTFGLKNKNKSSKVQAFVKQVEEQSKNTSAEAKRKEAEAARKAAEKKAAAEAKAEAAKLFASSLPTQKVPFGVDPKSVVCVFFKKGLCTKGSKCKFSHDLEVERKAQKKNLYEDQRTTKEQDTMDNWDEEKLRSVILSKHGNLKTTTDIICKHFISAVENGKYGWFWTCPNGGNECKYKHSLPPGFVLKTKEQQRLEKELANNKKEISLEDFIESERFKLPKQLTPVTLETFTKWKAERKEKKEKEEEVAAKKLKTKNMSGKQLLDSGKFVFEDDNDDNDAFDVAEMRRRVEQISEENMGAVMS